jgi:hypothetical protein
MAREAQASHRALAMAAISMRIGERNSPLALLYELFRFELGRNWPMPTFRS